MRVSSLFLMFVIATWLSIIDSCTPGSYNIQSTVLMDAYVDLSNPNSNYGDKTYIALQNSQTTWAKNGYVRFNIGDTVIEGQLGELPEFRNSLSPSSPTPTSLNPLNSHSNMRRWMPIPSRHCYTPSPHQSLPCSGPQILVHRNVRNFSLGPDHPHSRHSPESKHRTRFDRQHGLSELVQPRCEGSGLG